MTDEKPTKPGKKWQGAALADLRVRAATITPQELQAYEPTAEDMAIAETMLAGNVLLQDIAREANLSPSTVSAILRDPTRCAYICHQVHKLVETRLGMIDAAMFQRAVAGSERAAEVMYKRYDGIKQVQRTETVGNLEKMSIADLKSLVKEAVHMIEATDAIFKVVDDKAPEKKEGADGGSGQS
jgi:Bacterial regulatory proteins, lacI family